MMQLPFCVGIFPLILQKFLFPFVEVLWAWTTEAMKEQRRKVNSLETERKQGRQTPSGEKDAILLPAAFLNKNMQEMLLPGSRRQEQSSSHIPGLKRSWCKDRWKAIEQALYVSSVYNDVLKDYVFSSKCLLSGPSELSPFHSPAAEGLQLTACSLLHQVLLPSSLLLLLSCSSFFITVLELGPSSSTNGSPDCCRPQKLCLYPVSKLWASPGSKGSCNTLATALNFMLGSNVGG